MTENKFRSEMMKAQTFKTIELDPDRASYWVGYMRGLRRAYHGEKFGSADEHKKWMSLFYDSTRSEMGRGYRDGLNIDRTSEAASLMGRKGGQVRTPAKLRAALNNLSKVHRKRGRKPLPADQIQPASLRRREMRRNKSPKIPL
jgi:hypothetical protein